MTKYSLTNQGPCVCPVIMGNQYNYTCRGTLISQSIVNVCEINEPCILQYVPVMLAASSPLRSVHSSSSYKQLAQGRPFSL